VEQPDWKGTLGEAYELALAHLQGLPDRPVGPRASAAQLRAALGGDLPEESSDAREVVAGLAAAAGPGVAGTAGGRYFGFVVGGSTPAALAADWLTSAWDQNAGLYVLAPAAAVVEEVAGRWVTELLGLPPGSSVGFVTGAQMANFTALSIALREVLGRAGWDVDARGLWGAPRPRVLVGGQRHTTIDRALRFLGVGREAIVPVDVDDAGRMRAPALAAALAGHDGPAIVCTQVGNVNGGASDPVGELSDLAHGHGAWVHVDGAFGLWAAASPRLRHLVAGVERADSWATDAHKWLNVPYDSGLVICAHPRAHRAAMGVRAAYLQHDPDERDGIDYHPDFSRRARGVAVYAALRALGRRGVAEQVERSCRLAARFADGLAAADGVEVLGPVELNQVLVRFRAPGGSGAEDDDEHTRRVVERVQRDGTCWLSGTTWGGRAAMRVSISNWSTDEADVDRSVAAILRCAAG
jgi:glutamate/tyrosine decarboxylase-like PLP-dependent enzyme